MEEAIEGFISECREAKVQRGGVSPPWESQLLQRALWFKSTLSDPWSHPVLRTLLKSQENQLTDEEGKHLHTVVAISLTFDYFLFECTLC